jgi:hypothetical protein
MITECRWEPLQRAVNEWRKTYPRHRRRPAIRWGGASQFDDDDEASYVRRHRQQEALLIHLDRAFHLLLSPSGDADDLDRCTIWTRFAEWINDEQGVAPELPLADPCKLFHAFQCCEGGCRLRLRLMSRGEISVTGVEAETPVETLSSRILHDVLSNLAASTRLVWQQLVNDDGHDDVGD